MQSVITRDEKLVEKGFAGRWVPPMTEGGVVVVARGDLSQCGVVCSVGRVKPEEGRVVGVQKWAGRVRDA